jgi:tetratricopeptide (TPR) repeat protein
LLVATLSSPWWMPAGPRVAASVAAWQATPDAPQDGARSALDALAFERGEQLSATSLYNRGLALQQSGDAPRAIAAYRAAGDLSPRSPDVVHNLASARAELEGRIPAPIDPAPAWTAVLTPGELGVLAALFWLASAGLLHTARRRPDDARAPALAATAAAVVVSLIALDGQQAQLEHPVAVVLEEAVVRDGAEIEAGQRHVLPAGSEVRVERMRGAFTLVEDGKARRGWVLSEALAVAR